MNILITGASGFLGKNIQEHFHTRYRLICVSTSNKEPYIKLTKNFDNINERLADINIDCVIHLASVIPTNFKDADFHKCFLPNTIMLNNLYKFMILKNIKKFIYISSFGSMEDYANYKIKDYYTLSKIHGEHICSMMESAGIETASLRIPSPYGPYMKEENVINTFINNALNNLDINVYGSGKREQNFIYVEDVIQAIEKFIITKNGINGVYYIVSEKNTSMLELAQVIKQICNSESRIIVGKYEDPQEFFSPQYDYNRAYCEIGYKPNYNIYSGLTKYIEWYINNI